MSNDDDLMCGAHAGQTAPCLGCLHAQVTRDHHELRALQKLVEQIDERLSTTRAFNPKVVADVKARFKHLHPCEACGSKELAREADCVLESCPLKRAGQGEKGQQLVAAPPSPPADAAGGVVAEAIEPSPSTTPRPQAASSEVTASLVAMVRRAAREIPDRSLKVALLSDLADLCQRHGLSVGD